MVSNSAPVIDDTDLPLDGNGGEKACYYYDRLMEYRLPPSVFDDPELHPLSYSWGAIEGNSDA